jgi:hypothetical protein
MTNGTDVMPESFNPEKAQAQALVARWLQTEKGQQMLMRHVLAYLDEAPEAVPPGSPMHQAWLDFIDKHPFVIEPSKDIEVY